MTGSPIAIFSNGAGWFWDDAEDHGGFDRVSPTGPFEDYEAAKQDAIDTCGALAISRFIDGVPEHYPEAWLI